jgi:hypothetical protein
MVEIADIVSAISSAAQARLARAEALRRRKREDIDRRAAGARFAELMAVAEKAAGSLRR